MQFTDYQSVYHMLRESAQRVPDLPACSWILDSGDIHSVSYADFLAQVRSAAKSLVALGIEKGDKVCILSYSCYEWVLIDLAVMSIGAVTVGIYQSNLAKDCGYIINHSDAVLVFAENEMQLSKLMKIRDEIPHIREVILFRGAPPSDDWVSSFDDFIARGSELPDEAIDQRIEGLAPDDDAAIVYTSGTTGVPKGAVLTHDNITFTAQSVYYSLESRDGDVCLLFLPLAHIFARTCVFTAIRADANVVFARSLETVAEDFRIVRPHWFPSVPRIYEKVYSKVIGGVEAKGGAALKIFRWACGVGAEVSALKQQHKPVPALTNLKYGLATKLVFSKVQDALGGRVRWCISGAAPLNPDIGRFFHAAGVLIVEGIGMTENTSFTNVNRADNYRFGWVGPTGPGIEQKIAADGEVMFRGRNVMKEYYKMPEETAETLTADGWQHTGDLGEIDDEGFLKITGRKKDLIVTAGGKNVAPAPIEGALATSKYINQVCVIGDRQKYLSAVLTLDLENVAEYARDRGIAFQDPSELMTDPEVRQLIESVIAEKNQDLASFETIKKFRVLDEFTIENGLLTPTMKVKRNVVLDRFADVIDEMYSET